MITVTSLNSLCACTICWYENKMYETFHQWLCTKFCNNKKFPLCDLHVYTAVHVNVFCAFRSTFKLNS